MVKPPQGWVSLGGDVVEVLYFSSKDVTSQLRARVGSADKLLLVTAIREDGASRPVPEREPFVTLERRFGERVDQVICVDEGTPEGMWRDPMGTLADALFPGDRDCRQYASDNQHTPVECSSHDPDAYGFRDGLWTTNAFAGVRRALTRMAADTSELTPVEQWRDECRVRLARPTG